MKPVSIWGLLRELYDESFGVGHVYIDRVDRALKNFVETEKNIIQPNLILAFRNELAKAKKVNKEARKG